MRERAVHSLYGLPSNVCLLIAFEYSANAAYLLSPDCPPNCSQIHHCKPPCSIHDRGLSTFRLAGFSLKIPVPGLTTIRRLLTASLQHGTSCISFSQWRRRSLSICATFVDHRTDPKHPKYFPC